MQRSKVVLLLLSTLLGIGLAQEAPRSAVRGIQDYVVYYGQGQLEALATYDLAIVQPSQLSAEDVVYLHDRDTLVVAYLSLGEVEPSRPWYADGRVDPRWLLRKNKAWGSYAVDVRQEGWRRLMTQLTGEFLAAGFDGVFMDTVDVVDIYPETASSMVDLIQALRAAYPNALLIQNRGFAIVDEVASSVDAVMFESLTGSYDFDADTYVYADNSLTAEQMVALKERTSLVVLALDYADTPATAYRAVAAAKAYGFVPAVATILLDEIPTYGLGEGGPDDIRISGLSVQTVKTRTVIVVELENIGLSPSGRVSLSLTVKGGRIATKIYESLGIGEQESWQVLWERKAETASLRATAFSPTDTKADNDTASLAYTAQTDVEASRPPSDYRRPASNGPDLLASALSAHLTVDASLPWLTGPTCPARTSTAIRTSAWATLELAHGEFSEGQGQDVLFVRHALQQRVPNEAGQAAPFGPSYLGGHVPVKRLGKDGCVSKQVVVKLRDDKCQRSPESGVVRAV